MTVGLSTANMSDISCARKLEERVPTSHHMHRSLQIESLVFWLVRPRPWAYPNQSLLSANITQQLAWVRIKAHRCGSLRVGVTAGTQWAASNPSTTARPAQRFDSLCLDTLGWASALRVPIDLPTPAQSDLHIVTAWFWQTVGFKHYFR